MALCYRDRTFCSYWGGCKDGKECGRALTHTIEVKAREIRLPISQFADKPECFRDKVLSQII